MKKRTRFGMHKLVRDKILERFEKADIPTAWKKLSLEEHISALKDKLVEEAQEVVEADNLDDLAHEIADVKEVLDVLTAKVNIAKEQLEKIQRKKAEERGSLEQGLYIEYVDIAYGTEWYDYCARDPKKYPIIENDIE